MLLRRLFDLQRIHKKMILVAFDLAVLFCAYGISIYQLSNWELMPRYWAAHFISISVITLCIFSWCGLYSTMIRMLGAIELLEIFLAVLLSVVCFLIVNRINGVSVDLGAGSIFGGVVITFTVVSRLFIVELYALANVGSKTRVLLYGVGEIGVQVLPSLRSDNQYRVVAIIADEEEGLCGINVNGLKVQGASGLEKLIIKKKVEEVHLAIPESEILKRNKIIEKLQGISVGIKIISTVKGRVNCEATDILIRDLHIEDLISRETSNTDECIMKKCIADKVVLISGAGSSIGIELSREIEKRSPAHLVLMDASEDLLNDLEVEFLERTKQGKKKTKITAVLGGGLEKNRLNEIFQTFRVNTIYHAESYQQVPMVERNIIAAVIRNIFGVSDCVEAAHESGVENFVLVSSDKVVRPTNIVGVTKRISEQIVQGYSKRHSLENYCAVRCGNILDSKSSVVTLFKRQINRGGPVSITHPEMTRHFITASQAASLIIEAGAMAKKGEIFILNMGAPIKIIELLEKLAGVMGKNIKSKKTPSGTIHVKNIGLRDGEKIYEEFSTGDNPWGTGHPNIMIADETIPSLIELNVILSKLRSASKSYDCDCVREILREADSGYVPDGAVLDVVWRAKNERKLRSPNNVFQVHSI